jgi:glycerol-3-phosphate acyltransferase PlsY
MDPQTLLFDLVLVGLAYLSGSVPVGVLVARLSGGVDPRTVGSGRTGGTNALRALGRRRALVVVLGDVGKGLLPVLVARTVTGGDPAIEVACALAAVFGSGRSIFLRGGGGRGVGTGVGTLLAIQPLALLVAAPVFVGVILATRYVSLGSLLGSAAILPGVVIVFLVANGTIPTAYLVYATAGPALIWLSHIDNIRRLVAGTERRFDLGMLVGRGPTGS